MYIDTVDHTATQPSSFITGFRIQVDTGYSSQDTGLKIQVDTGLRIQVDTGLRIEVSGYRCQDTGVRIQVSGYRSQDTGLRIQVS